MASVAQPKILLKNMAAGKISQEISSTIAVKPVLNYVTIDKRASISSVKNAKKI